MVPISMGNVSVIFSFSRFLKSSKESTLVKSSTHCIFIFQPSKGQYFTLYFDSRVPVAKNMPNGWAWLLAGENFQMLHMRPPSTPMGLKLRRFLLYGNRFVRYMYVYFQIPIFGYEMWPFNKKFQQFIV